MSALKQPDVSSHDYKRSETHSLKVVVDGLEARIDGSVDISLALNSSDELGLGCHHGSIAEGDCFSVEQKYSRAEYYADSPL